MKIFVLGITIVILCFSWANAQTPAVKSQSTTNDTSTIRHPDGKLKPGSNSNKVEGNIKAPKVSSRVAPTRSQSTTDDTSTVRTPDGKLRPGVKLDSTGIRPK